jgi:hypothetical protein
MVNISMAYAMRNPKPWPPVWAGFDRVSASFGLSVPAVNWRG